MKTTYRNHRPVVGSFLKKVQEAGYTLVEFFDGSRWFPVEGTDREQRQAMKDIIVRSRYGLIRVYNKDSIARHVNISIDRRPEFMARTEPLDEDLTEVVEEFRNKWKGKEYPSR